MKYKPESKECYIKYLNRRKKLYVWSATARLYALCYMFDAPLSKFWTFLTNGCAVSKIEMRGIDDFRIGYWNRSEHL